MLIPSWRWFGPDDGITLDEVSQTGAHAVVTALHEIPAGQAWDESAIRKRKAMVEKAGMKWEVVESIPVHEDLKLRRGDHEKHLRNFITTLNRLGKHGVRTVCYNFMPALDWSRTDLAYPVSGGSILTGFNYTHFAVVDIHLLKRPGAAGDYPEQIRGAADRMYAEMQPAEAQRLKETFLLGFPGSGEEFTLEEVLDRIAAYEGLDKAAYRANLAAFLEAVVPAAEQAGVRLAIHPDDPPWPLMGMPRVFSSLEDAEYITGVIASPHNGITLCTGSLGALHSNNPASMAEALATRINFAHLRNVCRDDALNFHETHLLEGHVDMPGVMAALVKEDERRNREEGPGRDIPYRPDHGARILGDHQRKTYPGYSLYGRMKSLAEIRGLEEGIRFGMAAGHKR